MIKFTHKGDLSNTTRFFERAKQLAHISALDHYGKMGVEALRAATPVATGMTANSWTYSINQSSSGCSIEWSNENNQNGVNIAIILQYGHGTRNGGYVQGRDYVNPAIQPVFDQMADDLWKELEKP